MHEAAWLWPVSTTALVFLLAVGSRGLLRVDELGVSVMWVSAGATLGVLTVTPYRLWVRTVPPIVVAIGAANLVHGSTLAEAGVFAAANATEAMVGGAIMRGRRLGWIPALRGGGWFVGAAIAAAASGSLVAAALIPVSGKPPSFVLGFALSHLTAMVVVGAALLVMGRLSELQLPAGRRLEAVASVVVTVGTTMAVFLTDHGLPIAFVPLLPALWLALRAGAAATGGTAILGTFVAAMGTLAGRGPFAELADTVVGIAVLQTHMIATTVVSVTIAWAADQRRDALRQLQRSVGDLDVLASTDVLTGLPNRRHLERRLDEAFTHDGTASVGLLMMDCDGFKAVNDMGGHDAGDAVLCEMASRLRRVLRAQDDLVRMGGDEFAVLLIDADDRLLTRTADRLLAAFAEPLTTDEGTWRLGLSVGGAVCATTCSRSALLRRADQAMYAAKAAGGHQLHLDGTRDPAPAVTDAKCTGRVDVGPLGRPPDRPADTTRVPRPGGPGRRHQLRDRVSP